MIQPQLGVKTDVLATNKIVKWNRPHDDSRVWCHRDVQITNVLATSGIVKWNRAQLVRRADLQWVWSGLGLGPAPGLGCGFGRGLGCSWPWRRSWVAPCLLAPASALALATAALGRPGLSVPLSVCTPARPRGYRKIRRAKACDSCACRRAPRGRWKSPAPAPRAAASSKGAAAPSEEEWSVGCLTQRSAPAGVRKYLDAGLHTKCAQGPRSPQASAVELSDCPVRR